MCAPISAERPGVHLLRMPCITLDCVKVAMSPGDQAGRRISEPMARAWERTSRPAGQDNKHAVLAQAVARTPHLMMKGARFTQLGGIYADLEYIPVEGTRYDDGCDRSAPLEGGCKGQSMWVPKGARYPANIEPDDPVPEDELEALNDPDIQDPELSDGPSADHTAEVDAITAAPEAAQGCDSILDLAAWLACEEAKRV